jgi:hypothetical protein
MLRQLADAEHFDTGQRHFVVVLDRAAANPDGADQHAVLVDDRQAAGKVISPSLECSMP